MSQLWWLQFVVGFTVYQGLFSEKLADREWYLGWHVNKQAERFDSFPLCCVSSRSCSSNVWPGNWKPNDRLSPVSWRDASSALRLEAWLASGVCLCCLTPVRSSTLYLRACVSAVLLQVTVFFFFFFTAGHIRDMLLDLCPKSALSSNHSSKIMFCLRSQREAGAILLRSSGAPHHVTSYVPTHLQAQSYNIYLYCLIHC